MGPHQVQFYRNDDFLIEVMSGYIGSALTAGDQGIVIATRQHLDRLENSLCELELLERGPHRAQQRYIELDVDHMLPLFMNNGLPDRNRFHDAIGSVIARAAVHPGRVYVFGEMVAVLSGDTPYTQSSHGRHEAAIHVERYFNELLQKHRFTLLCAYPLAAFPKSEDDASFQHVCNLHSEVLPAEIFNRHTNLNVLQRTIASLQQKASALANEVHDRKQAERALREADPDRHTGLPNRDALPDSLIRKHKNGNRTGEKANRTAVPLVLSHDLQHALGAGQLQVFYQPIVDLESGRMVKAEALIRWDHPAIGPISPEDLIPLAEHKGLIVPIGEWVFQEALHQAQSCRAYDPQFTVSINISPVQFLRHKEGQYNEWIAHCRHSSLTGEAAGPTVSLEITEALLLEATPPVRSLLVEFRDAGIEILLGGFGTGYSALSCLREFNFDYIKIDRSLVLDLEHDEAGLVWCEAIIAMAHKLNLKVIAEGVETPRQQELLYRAGADLAQGFLFSHPLSAHELETLIKNAK